jgi:acetyltransferase-like isoleucine patch superfamily enzyme
VGPLEIGAGCWLGAKVVVLDGASIAEGSVVGAGAVVNRPLPARSLALGVPARVVKTIRRAGRGADPSAALDGRDPEREALQAGRRPGADGERGG